MRAAQLGDAVSDETIVVQFEVSAHAVELQHRGDAVRLLETHVSNILQHGLALCESAERRKNRQHIGDVPAVDAHAAQLDSFVLHA